MKLSLNKKDDDSHFMSLADMMTGLMMIFMLVALLSMRQISKENEISQQQDKKVKKQARIIKNLAIDYQDVQLELYKDLLREFKYDLPKWDATLDQDTLSITFHSPDVLFDKGQSVVKQRFKDILDDFFPRYINVIAKKYKQDIQEIRIEGYTDSDGRKNTVLENYFFNMQLSQDRTRNVLEYSLSIVEMQSQFDWLHNFITANGLSFSHLKYDEKGNEDKLASRRVEFRIKTNAEFKMRTIIENLQ